MIKEESGDNLMHSLNFSEFKNHMEFYNLPTDDREKIREFRENSELSSENDVTLKDVNYIMFEQKEYGKKNRVFNLGIIGDNEKTKQIEKEVNFYNCFNSGKPSIIQQFNNIFENIDKLKKFFLVDQDFMDNFEYENSLESND